MKNRLRVQNFQEILAGGGQPVYLYHMGPSTARTRFGDPGLSLISSMTARDRERMARELELRITNPQRWENPGSLIGTPGNIRPESVTRRAKDAHKFERWGTMAPGLYELG